MNSKELKTYGFSFRVSARSKFAAEVAAQIKGQSFATFVERACLEMANAQSIGGKNWEHFWDDSEAVRTLKLFLEPKYPTKDVHESAQRFVLAHKAFFFDGHEVNEHRAEVLFPQLEHYMDVWERTKSTSPGDAAEQMTAKLKKAGVKLPK